MNKTSKTLVKYLKELPIDIGQAQRKHNAAAKRIACSFIQKGNDKKALDVGCRDGYWSEWLKRKGYNVTSIDIEPHYKGAIQCDVEKSLPKSIRNKKYDLIFCTEVIEHLHKPDKFLRRMEKLLNKSGQIIITTPNSNWWLYWLIKPFGWTPKKVQNPDHKVFFNENSIKKIAPRYKLYGYFPYISNALKIESLIGVLSPTFILIYIKK